VLVQLVLVDGAPKRGQLRDLVANDQQLQVVEASPAQPVERLDQPHEVLVRLDVADVENELVIELIALADASDVLIDRRGREPIVDRVVHHDDLVRRHVEKTEQVALGRFRDGENPARPPRRAPHRCLCVHVRGPVRQVLRKHQMNAVVDRDDRTTANRRRQHVVRGMEDVGSLSAQHPRHMDLLADRVVGRRLEDGAEIRPELPPHAEVTFVTQQYVLGPTIETCQMPKQVLRVRADAEVVELASINRDAHQSMIQGSHRGGESWAVQ